MLNFIICDDNLEIVSKLSKMLESIFIKNNLDAVLKHFDSVIGLDKLKAIHLNDSRTPFNSRKDNHAKIGEGSIGLDAIINIINHPVLRDLPFYLETPNDLEGFKEEIALLKSKREEWFYILWYTNIKVVIYWKPRY